MHELGIALSLVEAMETIAQREGASRVLKAVLNIGALSGVDADALRFAFPAAAAGTRAECAELVIHVEPAEIVCEECGVVSHPAMEDVRCGKCDSRRIKMTAGRELKLESLELDVPDLAVE